MDYNYIGRPPKKETLARNGKSIMFWLDTRDYEKLLKLEKQSRLSRTAFLRDLIRNATLKGE